jgi:hypothetical protein
MVRDQAAQHFVRVLGIAQVARAVERVEAGSVEGGGVADVVEPRGSDQHVRVTAQDGASVSAVAATPWVCAQRRGSGCSSRRRARRSAQSAIGMAVTVCRNGGTVTFVPGRVRTSWDGPTTIRIAR